MNNSQSMESCIGDSIMCSGDLKWRASLENIIF
jgi:hypothetical protein